MHVMSGSWFALSFLCILVPQSLYAGEEGEKTIRADVVANRTIDAWRTESVSARRKEIALAEKDELLAYYKATLARTKRDIKSFFPLITKSITTVKETHKECEASKELEAELKKKAAQAEAEYIEQIVIAQENLSYAIDQLKKAEQENASAEKVKERTDKVKGLVEKEKEIRNTFGMRVAEANRNHSVAFLSTSRLRERLAFEGRAVKTYRSHIEGMIKSYQRELVSLETQYQSEQIELELAQKTLERIVGLKEREEQRVKLKKEMAEHKRAIAQYEALLKEHKQSPQTFDEELKSILQD